MRLRIAAFLALLMGALSLFLSAQAGASGAVPDEDRISVVGELEDTRTDPPEPVPGVKIAVTDDEGTEIASGQSNAQGAFKIPLKGEPIDLLGDTITVTLDNDSLPEGASLTEAGDVERTIEIKTDANISVNYSIGPDPNAVAWWVEPTTSLINGIVVGLLLALASIGISLVFGTTGLTNFAHGELFTFGAIVAFWFNSSFGWHILLAAPLAFLVAIGFGWAQDRGMWRPLRKNGTGLIAMMIVTIGFSILLRYLYQYFAGADAHQFEQYGTVEPWAIGDLEVSPKDLAVAVICIVVLVVVSLAVQKTRLGKATRAVSDNPDLAASSGINVDRVITVVWMTGTGLAGLGGVFYGLSYGFDYQTGFKILLLMFAAVTLGGLGTIWGAMAGSLVIGIIMEMSTLWLSSELKIAIPLLLLIVILLVRPQGILGRRERVG